MTVSILGLAYNEIDGMRVTLPRLKKEWYDQMVIVDGGSTDGSIEYARGAGYSVHVQEEPGAGPAFKEGMARMTGDVVVIFCPDGNFIPEKIPELLAKMKEGYRIVTGSRYLPGAKSEDDDPVTAFGNRFFTGLINFFYRVGTTDSLYGYYAFERKLIEELNVDTTSAWGPQIMIRAAKRGIKIGEVPASEPRRIGGVRKMRPVQNGLAVLKAIVKELFVRRF